MCDLSDKNAALLSLGIGLVAVISFTGGWTYSLTHAIMHVIEDLTVELPVHAYIAGWVIVIYIFCRMFWKHRNIYSLRA